MTAIHRPLDPEKRQLRLLKVVGFDSNEGADSDALRGFLLCEVDVFSLEDRPTYKALSYCWGQNASTVRIKINGQEFHVRPNLFCFLQQQRLVDANRRSTSGPNSTWIFIDAICINQQDVEERNSQVRLMGDIYRNATEVIAWLGIEGDIEQDFRAQKMSIMQFHHDLQMWQEIFDHLQVQLTMLARNRCLGLPSGRTMTMELDIIEKHMGLTAVTSLVLPLTNQQFWTRLWIVQEILLASTLTFWYKTLRVSWEVLYECLKYVYPTYVPMLDDLGIFDMLRRAMPATSVSGERLALRVFSILNCKLKSGLDARQHKLDLSTVVTSFAGQQCSVMHDKIYGLLGMTTAVVQLDYALPELVLYAQALVEGLTEIYYRHKADHARRRQEASAQFTVELARITGHNLHDFAVWLLTEECLKTVGQTMRASSLRWSLQERVSSSLLVKYGRGIGSFLGVTLPKLQHHATKLTFAFYDLGYPEVGYEKPVQAIYAHVVIRRFRHRESFDELLRSIRDLPVMTQPGAEALIENILAFPDHDMGLKLARAAVQHIEAEVLKLQSQKDRLSQDHVRALQSYNDRLAERVKNKQQPASPTSLAEASGESADPDEALRGMRDLGTIMQFMINPEWTRQIALEVHHDRHLVLEHEALLFSALLRFLSSPGPIHERAAKFWNKRIPDWDFADAAIRASNIHRVDGRLKTREFGDPGYRRGFADNFYITEDDLAVVSALAESVDFEFTELELKDEEAPAESSTAATEQTSGAAVVSAAHQRKPWRRSSDNEM